MEFILGCDRIMLSLYSGFHPLPTKHHTLPLFTDSHRLSRERGARDIFLQSGQR